MEDPISRGWVLLVAGRATKSWRATKGSWTSVGGCYNGECFGVWVWYICHFHENSIPWCLERSKPTKKWSKDSRKAHSQVIFSIAFREGHKQKGKLVKCMNWNILSSTNETLKPWIWEKNRLHNFQGSLLTIKNFKWATQSKTHITYLWPCLGKRMNTGSYLNVYDGFRAGSGISRLQQEFQLSLLGRWELSIPAPTVQEKNNRQGGREPEFWSWLSFYLSCPPLFL